MGKICVGCEINKDLSEFSKLKQSKDGLRYKCKQCSSEYNKEWGLKNPQRNAEINKEWHMKNADLISKRRKERYYKNRETELLSNKLWRYKNKDKKVIITQRRDANKKRASNTFTLADWNNCKNYFNNKCAYCGKKSFLEQDHFVSLSNGGGYDKDNIVTACKSCNSSKNAHSFFDWYPQHRCYSIVRERKILKYLNYESRHLQQVVLF